MSNNFEKFVDNLQKEIIKREVKEHNERIVKLFHNPYNIGKPPEKDITVFEERRGGPKLYFLGLYLRIEDGIIIKASYITDGCGFMVATGSQTMMLIEGKSIEYAENLSVDEISIALNGIPENEKHCVDFMVDTLRITLKKYKNRKKSRI